MSWPFCFNTNRTESTKVIGASVPAADSEHNPRFLLYPDPCAGTIRPGNLWCQAQSEFVSKLVRKCPQNLVSGGRGSLLVAASSGKQKESSLERTGPGARKLSRLGDHARFAGEWIRTVARTLDVGRRMGAAGCEALASFLATVLLNWFAVRRSVSGQRGFDETARGASALL